MKNGTKLTHVAIALRMNPKIARAKLRRVKVPSGMTVGNTWMLTAKGVTWAKKQLKA